MRMLRMLRVKESLAVLKMLFFKAPEAHVIAHRWVFFSSIPCVIL